MEQRSITRKDGGQGVYYIGPEANGGQVLVILPSTGRGGGDFRHISNELHALGHQVVLPEPRGIGGSDGPLDKISFHDLADDVAQILAAERCPPAVIVGHAFGNWIARTMAADHPGKVAGVVLLAAGAGTWPESLTGAIDTLAGNTATRAERLDALRHAFFASGNNPEPWLEGWNATVVAAQRAARPRSDRARWWPAGSAPILDLIAEDDPFRTPAHREDFQREFGDRVTIQLIAGASHALPDERPQESAAAIDAWIRRTLPRSG